MRTIEYYQVNECYDRSITVIGCFTDEDTAKYIAGGLENARFRSVYKQTLTIFDSVEDFENNTKAKLRERALAKLTVEERQALGV